MEEQVTINQRNNPTKVATKWALINALTAIIITYAIQLLNIDPNSPSKYISYIPFIIFLCLTQVEFKQRLGGFMSYGEGFSAGFRYSLFTGLLVAAFIFLYCKILSPDVFDKALEASRAKMEAQGMPSEQIEKGMAIGKKWGPLFGAFGAAIGYAIFGAIISIISTLIFKKERTADDIIGEATNPTL